MMNFIFISFDIIFLLFFFSNSLLSFWSEKIPNVVHTRKGKLMIENKIVYYKVIWNIFPFRFCQYNAHLVKKVINKRAGAQSGNWKKMDLYIQFFLVSFSLQCEKLFVFFVLWFFCSWAHLMENFDALQTVFLCCFHLDFLIYSFLWYLNSLSNTIFYTLLGLS